LLVVLQSISALRIRWQLVAVAVPQQLAEMALPHPPCTVEMEVQERVPQFLERSLITQVVAVEELTPEPMVAVVRVAQQQLAELVEVVLQVDVYLRRQIMQMLDQMELQTQVGAGEVRLLITAAT
jgi:hypothetical protein